MNEVILIVYIVFAVLSIILFFKIWRMCNDLHMLKLRSDEKRGDISMDELMFLYRTNTPAFSDTLLRMVYHDLYSQYRRDNRNEAAEWYQFKYNEWVKLCSNNGWEFPAAFVGVDTLDKFEEVFIPKQTL